MMMWRKPDGMKYTDMCIWIDEHAHELKEPDVNKQTAELIYNYIWLLVKALAIKKRMFEKFSDYDGYAMYGAKRLYFALQKSYVNEGKVIKGRTITPIKSILNYTKAIMYPMKLEYLHEQYNIISSAEDASKKFDEFACKTQLREAVWEEQGGQTNFRLDMTSLFENFNKQIDKVLEKSPFDKSSLDYKKLRISILLNCLNNLNAGKGLNAEPLTAVVWKLPKSMSSYVRVFIKKLGTQLKTEIISCYTDTQIDDRVLEFMMTNQSGEFNDHEE